MKMNSTKILLANTMVIGVTMTVCSNNWITMWMGLEVSILSFIPFMQNTKISTEESSIKYFIIQSLASACLMLGVLIMLIGVGMINMNLIINVAMMIKIGMAPFHNWVLNVAENLKYMVLLNLITIMKIPSMTIMSYCKFNINLPIMLSMVVGSMFCLNQTSMRKIIAFSSIYNIGLMTSVIEINYLWIYYMTIYSMMMMTVMKLLEQKKINFINQLVLNNFNPNLKTMLWINMLSLGGMPPLMGFIPKMMVLQMLLKKEMFLMIMVMILSSLVAMSFYLRLAFSSMFLYNILKKWEFNYNFKNYYMALMVNMLTPLILLMKMT